MTDTYGKIARIKAQLASLAESDQLPESVKIAISNAWADLYTAQRELNRQARQAAENQLPLPTGEMTSD